MQTAFAVTGACEVGGSRKGPQISAMPRTSDNSLRLGVGKCMGLSQQGPGEKPRPRRSLVSSEEIGSVLSLKRKEDGSVLSLAGE